MTDPWARPDEPEPQQQLRDAQPDQPAPSPGYANPSFGYSGAQGAPRDPEPPMGFEQSGYQPYGQPTGFQQGQLAPGHYGYPNELPEHPNAVTALVLGIVGFFTWITFPIAWYLGSKGISEMNRYPGRWRPSPALTAGKWIGMIGTLLGVLGTLAAFLLFFFIVANASR